MGYHFQLDKTLQERATDKLRKMLFRKSLMERWEPVENETKWVITGRPNAKHHKKILPEYCYNILELHRRTIYKSFTPLSEVLTFKNKRRALKCKTVAEARKVMTIDWDKLGTVFAMGERCQMFFEQELAPMLKREGLLKPSKKRGDEMLKLICGDRWLAKKLAEIQAQEPGKPVGEIVETDFNKMSGTTQKAIPEWHQKASEWEAFHDPKDGKVKLDGENVTQFPKLPDFQQVTLKVLRWEEKDKRFVIKDAELVA